MDEGQLYNDYYGNVFFKLILPKDYSLNAQYRQNLNDIRGSSSSVMENENIVLWEFGIGLYNLYLKVNGFDYDNSTIEIIRVRDIYQRRPLKFGEFLDIKE